MRFIKHSPIFKYLYVFFFTILAPQVPYVQACNQTFSPTSIPVTYIVNSGQVVCISGTGNLLGAIVVRAGGVLKTYQATSTGYITIDHAFGATSGGKLIKSSQIVVNGTNNNLGLSD